MVPPRHVHSTPEMSHSSQQSFEDVAMDLDSSSEWEADSDDLSDSDRDDQRGGDDGEEDDEDEQGDRPFELNPSSTSSLIDPSLPPVTSIQEMAAEMVGPWLPVFLDLAEKLGREIRIMTFCSGSDSLISFLRIIEDLVKKALVQKGSPHRLRIHHVASCESDRKKADFIERNFKPDLLFKDALELGSGAAEATLWSGKKAPIPGDIDLVIAGPSCKDYSLLNVNREPSKGEGKGKKVDAVRKRPVSGQSQQTFDALIGYVRTFRPKMLIIENVRSAPWPEMCTTVREISYSVEKISLNSTDFFLPCNRPRVYMVAFLNQPGPVDASNAVKKWARVVESLKRPPSLPAEAFLDPGRGDEPISTAAAVRPALASQVRQAEFSAAHNLGHQQPLRDNERWKSRIDPDVLASMSARAIRAIESLLLKFADQGRDLFELDVYIVVSNSTRYRTMSPSIGVSPCLTTRGRIFSTRLRRCLTSAEHLKLQGFPVEMLDFEGISYAVVKDMAGNGMAVPVVGAAMIAALVVAWTDTTLLAPRAGAVIARVPSIPDPPMEVARQPVPRTSSSLGQYRHVELARLALDLRRALRSASPEVGPPKPVSPKLAARLIKSAVPPALQFDQRGLKNALDQRQTDQQFFTIAGEEGEAKRRWRARIQQVCAQPFRLVPVEVGTATLRFESSSGVTIVELLRAVPQAYIFGKLQAGDLFRPSSPLASLLLPTNLSLVDGLLSRSWTLHPPSSATSTLLITGHGPPQPSIRSDLALPGYENEQVPSRLNVSRAGPSLAGLDRLPGSYERVDVSGCTPGSTWRHTTADPPIYHTLRTDPLGRSKWTGYVFTHQPEPVPHGTPLQDLARCGSVWRPSSDRPSEDVAISLCHLSLPTPGVHLSVPALPEVEIAQTAVSLYRPIITILQVTSPERDRLEQAPRTMSLTRQGKEALAPYHYLSQSLALGSYHKTLRGPLPKRIHLLQPRARETAFLFHDNGSDARIGFDAVWLACGLLNALPRRGLNPPKLTFELERTGDPSVVPPQFALPKLKSMSEHDLAAWVKERETGDATFVEKEMREETLSLDTVHWRARVIASQTVRRRGGILVGGIGDVKTMLPVLNLLLPPPAPPNSQRLTLFIVPALYDWERVITLSGRRVLRIKDESDLGRFSSQTPDSVEIVLIKESLLQTIMATSARMTPRARGSLVEIHSVNMMSKLQRFRWHALIYVSPLAKLSPLWVEWVRTLTVDVRWIWRATSAIATMDAIKQAAALLNVHLQDVYQPSPDCRMPRNSVVFTHPSHSFVIDQRKRAAFFVKVHVCQLDEPDRPPQAPKATAASRKKELKRAIPDVSTSAEASGSSKRLRTAAQQAELNEEEEVEVEVGQAGPGPSTMANRALAVKSSLLSQKVPLPSPALGERPVPSGSGAAVAQVDPIANAAAPVADPRPDEWDDDLDASLVIRVTDSQRYSLVLPMGPRAEVALEDEDEMAGVEMVDVTSSGQFVASQGAEAVDVDEYEWPEMTASGRFVSSSQASWIPSSLGSLTSSGQFKSVKG